MDDDTWIDPIDDVDQDELDRIAPDGDTPPPRVAVHPDHQGH